MDGVDHRFKQNQSTGWQAEARANHDAIVDVTGQAAFNRRDRSLVGVDKAVLGMPAPSCEIGQCEFDPSVDLFLRSCRAAALDPKSPLSQDQDRSTLRFSSTLFRTRILMRDILERFTVRQRDPSDAILPIDGKDAGS